MLCRWWVSLFSPSSWRFDLWRMAISSQVVGFRFVLPVMVCMLPCRGLIFVSATQLTWPQKWTVKVDLVLDQGNIYSWQHLHVELPMKLQGSIGLYTSRIHFKSQNSDGKRTCEVNMLGRKWAKRPQSSLGSLPREIIGWKNYRKLLKQVTNV